MAKADELTLPNIVKLVLLNMMHWASFLSIRDKRIWVFGSWDGTVFLDNPKYLFLTSQKLSPAIKPIWISNNTALVQSLRKKGFKAYYTFEFQAFFYALRAKYYFIDHAPLYGGFFSPINLWLSGGAKIIQLWHGLPLKRLDSVGLEAAKKDFFAEMVSIFSKLSLFNIYINCYAVAPSRFFGKILSQAFGISEERVILSGYPRNVFQKIPEGVSLQYTLNQRINSLKAQGKKLVFYIPTFRDYGGNPVKDEAIDLPALKRFINGQDCVFLVKFHEVDETKIESSNQEIIYLPSGFDIYEILHLCDILVTDYSSIFFDFLIFNKPIVFYPYDLSKYKKSARCFYFKYDQFVPGPIVYRFNDLLSLLAEILETGSDGYEEKRLRLEEFSFKCHKLMFGNLLVDY